MADRTVYLAEAGPKGQAAAFEALRVEEWGAAKKLEEWEDDCKNAGEWWFSVTELEASL